VDPDWIREFLFDVNYYSEKLMSFKLKTHAIRQAMISFSENHWKIIELATANVL